ncbi:MAG: hypothetical protein RSE13_24065 [Planktothrix sp. GU0601_MAG3]|nr:MAG: hypothetical protein RSE13_24065 [Planktothrix sp. GU0601_MAG3]
MATSMMVGEGGGGIQCISAPCPGSEGGGGYPAKPISIDPYPMTTMALGEEGGEYLPIDPPEMTTMALGEEGGDPMYY